MARLCIKTPSVRAQPLCVDIFTVSFRICLPQQASPSRLLLCLGGDIMESSSILSFWVKEREFLSVLLTLSNGFYVRHLHVSGSSNKRVNIRSVAVSFLNKHNAE